MCTIYVSGAHRNQRRISDSLDLELQVVVSHPLWALGSKPGSSVKAVNTLLNFLPPFQLYFSPLH